MNSKKYRAPNELPQPYTATYISELEEVLKARVARTPAGGVRGLLLLVALSSMGAIIYEQVSGDSWAVPILAVCALAGTFILDERLHARTRRLIADLQQLGPVPDNQLAQALSLLKELPNELTYREAFSAQKREMVLGELRAVHDYSASRNEDVRKFKAASGIAEVRLSLYGQSIVCQRPTIPHKIRRAKDTQVVLKAENGVWKRRFDLADNERCGELYA